LLNLGALQIHLPELAGIGVGEIAAQKITPFAAAGAA